MNAHRTNPTSADVFGQRVVAHLDLAKHQLPYDISERLRAARMRALAVRLVSQTEWQTAGDVQAQDGLLSMKLPSKAHMFLNSFVSIIPLICLAAGLVLLYDFHNDQSALELAEVDSALLVDDLPPQAYADPGFAHFLKNSNNNE